ARASAQMTVTPAASPLLASTDRNAAHTAGSRSMAMVDVAGRFLSSTWAVPAKASMKTECGGISEIIRCHTPAPPLLPGNLVKAGEGRSAAAVIAETGDAAGARYFERAAFFMRARSAIRV